MILKSIRLSGWRCFLDEITIGSFSEGLNVISGPNGSGKSTLFEALRRALMDSYAVTGVDVNEIQPWGRALRPRVTVSFLHAGTTYQVAKQFLDGGFSRLERMESASFRPLAEGRQADEYVRELLSRNPPGRGFSQPRNWGLAQVLWAPQGEIKLGTLSGDVVSDIRTFLGVQVSGRESGPIEQKIADLFDRYFTKQGKVKTGKTSPPVVGLRDELVHAEQRRRGSLELLQRHDASSRRVEELNARYRQMLVGADELVKSIKNARRRADEYRLLKAEIKGRRSEMGKIEAQQRQLKQQIEMIRSAEKDLRDAIGHMGKLESEAPLKRREVEDRSKDAAAAKKSLESARNGEDEVAKAERHAEVARQYAEFEMRQAGLSSRIRKIETAEQALSGCKKAQAALVAPDNKTLKAIRNAIQERDGARLLMDAAMISLEIVPESAGVLEVMAAEEIGQIPLSRGTPTIIKGSPEIVAELKGVARLRASGPAGDVQTHRRTVRESEQRINELTRPFGSDDIGRLEDLAEEATSLDRQASEALKEFQTLLGEDELEGLKREHLRLGALLAGIEKEYPGWRGTPPDVDVFKRRAADLKREWGRKVSEAETGWEKTQTALSAAKQQEQILADRLEDARKTVKKLETHLSELTRDGKQFQDREKELQQILLEWDAGKAVLKELEDKQDLFEGDPETDLKNLERQVEASQDLARKTRDEERTAMGNLETLSAQGPYSALAQAEEETAQLQEEIRTEELRMDAIRLLHDTLVRCRTEAVASVARPVQEAATRLMQRIAGRRIGRIDIGESFEPSGVSPESAGSSVGLDNLSGGEQEQLYLATRLALAEVLAKDERQMVVLDDVLTATDAGRLARVMTLLEEAAQRLQIVILTCHPERYRALAGAEFFDLESLISGS